MTVEEAKDILNYMIDDIKDFCACGKHMSDESEREMEALEMAIKALEQQSLRWIPFETKEPDEEEKRLYPNRDSVLYGNLPDDGERILVSFKCKGHESVQIDDYIDDGGIFVP